MKGKVLGAQEMERAQKRVRLESRVILDKLMSVNMMWFAQFYCELLLQVGLAPVQETDQELLTIADEEKLQVSVLQHSVCRHKVTIRLHNVLLLPSLFFFIAMLHSFPLPSLEIAQKILQQEFTCRQEQQKDIHSSKG